MSYQALLFCPDEKTARTVTQVLGDLDFNVTACTEPFAAVKKFMSERFDAVVVDCDNEQNATLLFKSARSAPINQAALAVAVVEGQAGVAKAFRIGANLVLTKPINVEQAKGTLRVARGLLRKNEGAKPPSGAANAALKPSAVASVPAMPSQQPAISTASEVRTTAPAVPPTSAHVIPIQRPAAQPSIVASVPEEIAKENVEPAVSIRSVPEGADLIPSQSTSVALSATKVAPVTAPHRETNISSGYAASAPAPAREPAASAPTEHTQTLDTANRDIQIDSKDHTASAHKTSAPASTLTFGGTVVSGQRRASNGSKMKLIAAVTIVLIAAGGYAAWMKWTPLNTPTKAPASIATRPAATSTPVAPVASTRNPENTPPIAETQATDSQTSETQSFHNESQKPAKVAKAENHPPKVNTAFEAPKPDASVMAENTPAASTPAPQPIVIKSDGGKASAKTTESTEAPALSMTAIAPADEALPNLTGSATAPTPVLQRLVVSQGVSRGLLVKQVQPVYPRAAIQMRIEGSVELMATIAKTGSISEVKALTGDKELARAAIDAVKQWKYKPYLLNGEPVDIQTQITVNFKLPE
jgi:TonB family protein